MAQIIDGKAIAGEIRCEIAAEVAALSSAHNIVSGLVVIVGSKKDSHTYMQMKRKACAEVGIRSFDVDLPEDISKAALVAKVHHLNADPAVHDAVIPSRFVQKNSWTVKFGPTNTRADDPSWVGCHSFAAWDSLARICSSVELA